MLQKLWQLKLGWDELIPTELFSVWINFYNQLNFLNEIRIPRQIMILNAMKFEIHGFCDASESSYGACNGCPKRFLLFRGYISRERLGVGGSGQLQS